MIIKAPFCKNRQIGKANKHKHILISASQSYQTAQEKFLEGKPQGVFTYTLTKFMREHQNFNISFLRNNLAKNINALSNQTPRIDIFNLNDNEVLF